MEESFCDSIANFDYSVNKKELRIEKIFVKQFNSDIYFKPSNVSKFVLGLIVNLIKIFYNGDEADLESLKAIKELEDLNIKKEWFRNLK